MKILSSLLGGVALILSSVSLSQAMDGVVVSVKPIHSLVAGVMAGIGEPEVIVDGNASPHAYSLKPSQARSLQNSKMVIWVGEGLETFLIKPIETLGENAKIIELLDLDELKRVGFRKGGAFDGHDHANHGEHHENDADEHADKHADEHEHKHADEHANEHAEKHADEHGSEHAQGHDDHKDFDPHVWLDPENAKIIVGEISRALSEVDPTNAAGYASNAKALQTQLTELSEHLATSLEPVKDLPFVVFHDAYRYFEERYGLNAVGSLTVNPDVAPGAARISELRNKLEELGAVCVFSEPQFPSNTVNLLTEGNDAKSAVLDPLGAGLQKGAGLYFDLMKGMAQSFEACLSK